MTPIQKPDYFDEIRQNSVDVWHQLEQSRQLAGPWHQLFEQVQSPRHVLSELLQNADDAEATEVNVQISEGEFSFSHNGKDFSKGDFASLCRFGYSNKRLLRTIGFRGIGFKSTFSLGDTVYLSTPTLAVTFHKSKFTLPHWIDGNTTSDGTTQIRVKFENERLQKELENNVAEWLNSPFSLLFFNHIRKLRLGDHDLSWKSSGTGPIPNSEKMVLNGGQTPYLVIHSEFESFPDEALKEINEARWVDMDENANIPPCKIEIVLGARGQLFVVLPTGVKTNLSFAVNAPFIQDPSRLKIKDPEASFTNRWLLERAGKLAANAMLHWLDNQDLDVSERAKSYDLMPAPNEKEDSLENSCKMVIEEAFLCALQEKAYVLTDEGNLTLPGKTANVPAVLWDIWSATEIAEILREKDERPSLLSRHVNENNRKKLFAYQVVSSFEQDDILNILTKLSPPKPADWTSLLELWNFAGRWNYSWEYKKLNIHPVRGRDILLSTNKVVRLGEKRLLQSEDDWDFLAKHLFVLDVNWLRFLTEQRRISEETNNSILREKVAVADQLLTRTELDKPSNVDMVLEQVAIDFFAYYAPSLDDSVRITQIASKLNAKIGKSFKFYTRDGQLRTSNKMILFDDKGLLEEFIVPAEREHVLLHEQYSQFLSCSKEEWFTWVDSGNAGVKRFVSINQTEQYIIGDDRIKKEVENRGQSSDAIEYQYKTSDYLLEDWDFPKEYWEYWETCANEDTSFWVRLVEHLLHQRVIWDIAKSARIFHIATTGSRKLLVYKPLLPTWIQKLQVLPCLPDSRGKYHIPHELMRYTQQTESLMDVEPFVDARLDTDATRPLLIMLGVRDTPTGPKNILERIRALAKAQKPPVLELTKWYQRLDALFENCSTEEQHNVRESFRKEKLILADDGTWQTSESIFISAEEHDVPGAALVYSLANQIALWRKLGVNERPTAELAIQWLMSLPINEKPSASDAKRINSFLGRHPVRIWRECERWLNLSGEWVPTKNLHYCLTMKSLFRYGSLFDWVKSETADLRMLSIDLTKELPFSVLPTLASQVERNLKQFSEQGRSVSLNWLQTLGRLLSRIDIGDESKNQYIHTQAKRLAVTKGLQVDTITTLPYLNGKPAGIAESEDLVWVDQTIYMTKLSNSRMASRISKQVAGVFDWAEMEALLTYCFERNEETIRSYLEENFALAPGETAQTTDDLPAADAESDHEPIAEAAPDLPSEEENTVDPEILPDFGDSVIDDGVGDYAGQSRSPHSGRTSQPKTPLVERYALTQGYQKRDTHHFIHVDGRVLIKSEGVFPWAIREANGAISLYLWLREHCLELKPLDLPTEVWHLIEQDSQRYALVLEDRHGEPIQFSGKDLMASKQAGQLKLHVATYRISLLKDS